MHEAWHIATSPCDTGRFVSRLADCLFSFGFRFQFIRSVWAVNKAQDSSLTCYWSFFIKFLICDIAQKNSALSSRTCECYLVTTKMRISYLIASYWCTLCRKLQFLVRFLVDFLLVIDANNWSKGHIKQKIFLLLFNFPRTFTIALYFLFHYILSELI